MTEPAPAPGRRVHREHDAVSQVVRGWYTSAVPEIGLEGTERWFGFAGQTGPGRARVVLSIADPAEVPAAPAAARAACAAGSRWVAAARRAGGRSQIINAADGGAPAARYRRLGFTAEVYWYSTYELPS
jgi:hypothetical protein